MQYVAMVDGKRSLFGGVPLNTNFCMSNPDARGKVVQYVADYAESHQNVDFLHIWLADGTNNHCECPACAEKTTSDWYILLLNEIDAELTRQNGRYAVTVGGVTVELSDEKQQRLAEHNVAEQDVTLGVRPDHIMLCADGVKGTVDVSEMMGSSVHLHVTAEGKDVIIIVPTNGAAAHFPMGSEVNMIFGGNVAHVFDKTTGKNLEW